jgi:hypothetical protein
LEKAPVFAKVVLVIGETSPFYLDGSGFAKINRNRGERVGLAAISAKVVRWCKPINVLGNTFWNNQLEKALTQRFGARITTCGKSNLPP